MKFELRIISSQTSGNESCRLRKRAEVVTGFGDAAVFILQRVGNVHDFINV